MNKQLQQAKKFILNKQSIIIAFFLGCISFWIVDRVIALNTNIIVSRIFLTKYGHFQWSSLSAFTIAIATATFYSNKKKEREDKRREWINATREPLTELLSSFTDVSGKILTIKEELEQSYKRYGYKTVNEIVQNNNLIKGLVQLLNDLTEFIPNINKYSAILYLLLDENPRSHLDNLRKLFKESNDVLIKFQDGNEDSLTTSTKLGEIHFRIDKEIEETLKTLRNIYIDTSIMIGIHTTNEE